MTNFEPRLNVAILDSEPARTLARIIDGTGKADTVSWHTEADTVVNSFREGKANSLFINIFSLGTEAGIQLIEKIRERFSHVPICLVGTRDELTTFPGVTDYWKKRFDHYYWLINDLPARQIHREAEAILQRMESYLLSKAAMGRLENVRGYLAQFLSDRDAPNEAATGEAIEALDLAKRALETKQKTQAAIYTIVPGFDDSDVKDLIAKTLANSTMALRRTAVVNMVVLVAGGLLLFASFVVAIVTRTWESVTFGGFGLAGVVTALIANPLRSISKGGRHIVQIQVAYLGFLNQLAVLGRIPADTSGDTILERSKQLNVAISHVSEALEKHFD
jgi:hypothetical protein